jgi:hypothetical protein
MVQKLGKLLSPALGRRRLLVYGLWDGIPKLSHSRIMGMFSLNRTGFFQRYGQQLFLRCWAPLVNA